MASSSITNESAFFAALSIPRALRGFLMLAAITIAFLALATAQMSLPLTMAQRESGRAERTFRGLRPSIFSYMLESTA
ncbi:MAG: hypothetical protein BWX47_02132 [candidate division Hyd24-12 bacterium ADurb.Bin004]|nr:MAG: hypothetical protein BWX47_02132 [candidate division Hyd24-12 bacterium ADurb.Bin004]